MSESFSTWRPHPWHGLDAGENSPNVVNAYIEITPFDVVKYEIDKETGYLRVDRPHRATSQPPTLYGFIPQTYCGEEVALMSEHADQGDLDPLDICVISERPINHSEVILNAKVVGGLHMIDGGEADDKIIAVLENDNLWSEINDIAELPGIFVERLTHYFETYKMIPGHESTAKITGVYDHEMAKKVILASQRDYQNKFGK
jgi:inorganic pyrophosphatase